MERDTKQRRAIREIFKRERRPLSTDEVLAAGRRLVPSLGIATVYRIIHSLSDEGWIHSVELPGESARYERCGKPHHHHFMGGTAVRVGWCSMSLPVQKTWSGWRPRALRSTHTNWCSTDTVQGAAGHDGAGPGPPGLRHTRLGRISGGVSIVAAPEPGIRARLETPNGEIDLS